MQRINFAIVLLFLSLAGMGQKRKNVFKQKGFLFITAYNCRYDWKGEHMRPLGFHDFFFPTQRFDISMRRGSSVFTDGIRVDSMPQRFYVKNKSLKVFGVDSSQCYNYDSFYIVPVQIAYREIEEYEPLVCRKTSFSIQQGQINRVFQFMKKAVVITEIVLYPDDKRRAERL